MFHEITFFKEKCKFFLRDDKTHQNIITRKYSHKQIKLAKSFASDLIVVISQECEKKKCKMKTK